MKYTKNLVQNYQKIMIFGCSGSGKSTLARQISEEHGIPEYPLDKIKWQPNWQKTPAKEVVQQIDDLINQNSYIIEGRYNKKLQKAIDDCDLIIILNTPTIVCLKRVIWRTLKSFLTGKKGAREDLPVGCKESFGLGYLELLKIIIDYKKTKGAETTKALAQYKDKIKVI